MKNIFLLIFILIFLYFICNRYIENFSVGGQSNGQDNDNKINISGSLTLSYIDNCNPCQNDGKYVNGICKCSASYTGNKCNICKENTDTPNYTYWVHPNTCDCPENTTLYNSSGYTRCGPPPPPPPPPSPPPPPPPTACKCYRESKNQPPCNSKIEEYCKNNGSSNSRTCNDLKYRDPNIYRNITSCKWYEGVIPETPELCHKGLRNLKIGSHEAGTWDGMDNKICEKVKKKNWNPFKGNPFKDDARSENCVNNCQNCYQSTNYDINGDPDNFEIGYTCKNNGDTCSIDKLCYLE